MKKKLLVTMAGAALSVLVMAGCSQESPAPAPAQDAPTSEAPSPSEAESEAVLTTAETDLGTVVVDAEGMTVYVFDNDVPDSGESSCAGDCLVAWPPVVAESEEPTAEGVEGELGTITGTDGSTQLTLNGWPLYYYQQDEAPGDVTGQAVGGVWWVVGENGEKITEGGAAG